MTKKRGRPNKQRKSRSIRGWSGQVRVNAGARLDSSVDPGYRCANQQRDTHSKKKKKVSSTTQLTEWRRLLQVWGSPSVAFSQTHPYTHSRFSLPTYLNLYNIREGRLEIGALNEVCLTSDVSVSSKLLHLALRQPTFFLRQPDSAEGGQVPR